MVLGVFTCGLLAGGVLSAGVLWLVSGLFTPLPVGVRQGLIVAVALLAALRDAGKLSLRLPQNARQIPQDVLRRHLARGALQFGFELGTGVRTYVSASAPYAMAVAVLLSGGSYAPALAAGLGFGAGRALTPALRRLSGDGECWDDRLAERLSGMTVVCSVLTAAAACGVWQ
ncbi:hypothetical protein [Streptomyces sp. NBC_01022]|uniref:hypothetical protein n=1 Tax=Streptomyces sp. NBC_01022 TaxID=2903723 RepID=UPI002DDA0E7D|nr:hypothetical protein [Streptomyces sp. NBC_01022]WRZ80227.1 hypothetical protein OG316_08125 [Streptomyces sp. NBC_01022]